MADTTVVVEGKIKFRDGKKWKPRWCVMKKPSPVADRLQVLLYKDFKDTRRDGAKPKTVFPLEGFYGLESFSFDKEANVLAVLCQKQVTLLSFESREYMIQFEIKIRRSLGQEHQFPVQMAKVPHNSRLPLELVRMHIHGQKFCLTAYIPPKILQSWQICDLRRFGSVEGKFCFEGGSKCGRGMGIHVALSEQAEEISNIVQLASQGKLTSCNMNKRSSQIPGAFDSGGSSFPSGHHGLPPSTMLGCCGDTHNRDDWGWQKRHSISVMDYRRMTAFAEKSKLMSIENLERQRLLAIYDVPPKRIRKVEPEKVANTNWQQNTDNSKLCSSCSTQKSQSAEVAQSCTHVAVCRMPYETAGESCALGVTSTQSSKNQLKYNEDFLGYSKSLGSQGNYQLSVIEDEIRMANDRTKRKEAMQKLQREENSLQREITLLDEILQVCKFDEESKGREQRVGKACNNTAEKSSSLPSKSKKDLRIDIKLCNKEGAQLSAAQTGLQKEDLEAACLSPNLLNKLKEIPSHSKLLAPLPYINLSKYDDDGDKSNHVHLSGSGDKLVTASGCSSSLSNVSLFNKENSPYVHNIKQKLGARSSSESRIAAKSSQWEKEKASDSVPQWKREPIYANEVQRKSDTPPPELPPKGPALLRKNLGRSSAVVPQSSSCLSPPALPARDRSCSLGSQGKLHGYDNAPGQSSSKPGTVGPQDSYLLMLGFQEEPKCTFDTSYDGSESYHTNVICEGQIARAQGGRSSDMSSQYMEMAGQFELECSKLRISDSSSSESDLYGYSPSPRPSIELRISEPIDENPPFLNKAAQESNYMEMSGLHSNRNSQVIQNLQTLQNYVSSTRGGDNCLANKSDVSRTAMPFPNLLNFQKRQSDQKRPSTGMTNSTSVINEQPSTPDAPKEGFLARFIRRSSRDQKAASQSQENLTGPRSRASFLERSQSDQGNEPTKLSDTPHMKIGRQRSSSFPNRLSYQEANTEIKSQEDTHPPLPPERNRGREYRGSKSLSLDDTPYPPAQIFRKSENSQTLKRNITEPLLKGEEEKPEMKVLTVLHVQQELKMTSPYMQLGYSSKTDDEKIIEKMRNSGGAKLDFDDKGYYDSLSDLKSKMNLPLTVKKPLTASEQAAEIARHVTSLPPFIPPKTKSYPTSLSPVIETQLSPHGMDSESIYVEMRELPVGPTNASALDPAAQKNQARDSLRISPPVEDENGKIWVPRCSLNSTENNPDMLDGGSKCDSNLQYSALVVSLDDLNDKLDAISVSSHESSDANSSHSEETVRSSPASTILRPRSGKEYQVVERKRTASGSCTSSPKTPYSPSSANVFSFEGFSTSSTLGEEPNSYMNLDMTPGVKHSLGRHASDHETTPERSLQEKHSSDRDTAHSCVREVISNERKRLTSYKNNSHPDSPKLQATRGKSRMSPEKESTTPGQDKSHSGRRDIEVDCCCFDQETCCRDASIERESSSCEKDTSCEQTVCDQHHDAVDCLVTPNVPTSRAIAPEQIEPQLNYAEIDLSTACSSPSPQESKRRPKKSPSSKPTAYATIDMVATNAVKKAGIEHAQARDSLRRSVSVHVRNASTPMVRDRKFSMRERKMSTGSIGDS